LPNFLLISILFFLSFTSVYAQSFEWAAHYGDASGESLKGLVSDESGNLYLCGNFSEKIQIGTDELTATHEEDLYLIQTDNQGQIKWGISISSPENIDIGGLVIYDNALYVAAQYWENTMFEDSLVLTPTQGSGSAFFLVKYSTGGQFLWAKSIEGSGLKKVADVHTDTEGNVYLTGYFGASLFVGTDALIAEGNTNFFILKYTSDGELVWAKQAGDSDDIRARCMATDMLGNVYIGGNFEGNLTFAGQQIIGNGLDNNIFLLKYDSIGNEIWLREARGVFEDSLNDMVVSSDGTIYLTGAFSGVLRFGERELTTIGFNDDIFVAKYTTHGHFLWAEAVEGSGFGSGESLILDDEQLYLAGEFRGESVFGSTTLTADAIQPDIFIAAMDTSGTFEWVKQGGDTNTDLLEQLTLLPDGTLVAGGSFDQFTQFDNIQLPSNGGYDAYLAALRPASVHTPSLHPNDDIEVFPIPAHEIFHVKINTHFTDNCQINLWNTAGKIIQSFSWHKSLSEQTISISTNSLPVGIYLLTFQCGDEIQSKKILVE